MVTFRSRLTLAWVLPHNSMSSLGRKESSDCLLNKNPGKLRQAWWSGFSPAFYMYPHETTCYLQLFLSYPLATAGGHKPVDFHWLGVCPVSDLAPDFFRHWSPTW